MEKLDPLPPITALVEALKGLGPGPTILAAAIVGMTLGIILLARLGNVWGAVRAGRGTDALLATLTRMVADNRATEEALRRRLDAAERDRTLTRDELDEARSQVALLRHQRQRLVSMMRELVKRLPEPAIRSNGGAT